MRRARKKRRLERPRDTVSNSMGRHVTYHRGPVTMSATLQMSSKIWLRGVSGRHVAEMSATFPTKHGNSCLVGQLPAIEQSQNQFLMMIIAMHIF
jgi:hypothetical protein